MYGRQHAAAARRIAEIAAEFEPEFFALPQDVQDEILTTTRLLRQFGLQLGTTAGKHAQRLAGMRT